MQSHICVGRSWFKKPWGRQCHLCTLFSQPFTSLEQHIISSTSRRALGGRWFHLQKDHQIILHLWDLLEIPSPGAGFCNGCFSYWGTAAENIRAESMLWAGAPFLLPLVYVQNRQNLWKVAAKLCSYKTQLSKDTVCRFHACVSVHVTELNTRLWICKRGKTISQEPGFPQNCISITPVPSNAWRRLQSMEASRRTPEPQPHPSGSCSSSAGAWLQHGGVEREARRGKGPFKIEGHEMRR